MTDSNSAATAAAATFIRCERFPINPALLSPFSVGEIIARSDRLEVNGENIKQLSFRPFGNLSIEGDIRAALPAVLSWIDEQAMVEGSACSWQEAIAKILLQGGTVDIGKLPAAVLRNCPK